MRAERVASLEQDLTQRTAGVAFLVVAPEQGGQTFAGLLARLAESKVGEQSARPAIGQVHAPVALLSPTPPKTEILRTVIAALPPDATGRPRLDDWR